MSPAQDMHDYVRPAGAAWSEHAEPVGVLPLEAPSNIYTAGSEYHSAALQTRHFALCGQYQVADRELWYVRIE